MIGVDVIVSSIFGILDRIIPDKNAAAKAKAEIEMYTLSAEFQLSNVNVTGTEASVSYQIPLNFQIEALF